MLQIPTPIGRMFSEGLSYTMVSGTTLSSNYIDFRGYAGAILETPLGHTGTISIYESGEYGGNYGSLADDTDTDYTITANKGGKPYSFPAGVFPAHFLKIGIPAAATATRTYKVRAKG